MNESYRELTVDALAMQIEEDGLTAAIAPLRANTIAVTTLAARACSAVRSALTDAALSDVAWLQAYVAARTTSADRALPVAA